MKTASVTESKNELSRLLRSVRAGRSILILDRDVPVARLEPVVAEALPDELKLRALERQGLLRRARQKGDPAARLRALPAPRVQPGRSVTAALLAERDEAAR